MTTLSKEGIMPTKKTDWVECDWETGKPLESKKLYAYRVVFECSPDDIERLLEDILAYSNIESVERRDAT